MKVLFPIGSFPPAKTAGAGIFLYSTTKGLHTTGKTENYIVSTETDLDSETARDTWFKNECGNVIFCKIRIHYLAYNMVRTAVKLLKKVDIVHLNGLFYPPSMMIALFAYMHNKKIIWSVHGSLYKEALLYSSGKKKLFLFLIKRLKRKVFFHATSDPEYKLIKEKLSSKNKIINIPIFMDSASNEPEYKLNPQPYFLFVGRIAEIKLLDVLIEAFAQSDYFRNSTFSFKIVGNPDNPYGQKLKAKANELKLDHKIEFVGDARGKVKDELFKNAYFTFLVSKSENFGMVVLESLREGTPVIASHGTPWQQLDETQAGFWIDNSEKSLSDIIDKTIHLEEDNYKNYRKNALAMFADNFDINKNINNWIEEYQNCLNN